MSLAVVPPVVWPTDIQIGHHVQKQFLGMTVNMDTIWARTIRTSSGPSVFLRSPSLNILAVSATATPAPKREPVPAPSSGELRASSR